MQRFLLVLALVAAGVIGLGFYRGWFHIGSDADAGKSNVTLTVDTHKMQEDKKTAVDDLKGVEHKIKDKVTTPAGQTMDGTVVSVTGDRLTMTTAAGEEYSHAWRPPSR